MKNIEARNHLFSIHHKVEPFSQNCQGYINAKHFFKFFCLISKLFEFNSMFSFLERLEKKLKKMPCALDKFEKKPLMLLKIVKK